MHSIPDSSILRCSVEAIVRRYALLRRIELTVSRGEEVSAPPQIQRKRSTVRERWRMRRIIILRRTHTPHTHKYKQKPADHLFWLCRQRMSDQRGSDEDRRQGVKGVCETKEWEENNLLFYKFVAFLPVLSSPMFRVLQLFSGVILFHVQLFKLGRQHRISRRSTFFPCYSFFFFQDLWRAPNQYLTLRRRRREHPIPYCRLVLACELGSWEKYR